MSTNNHALDQTQAQYDSIVAMLGAVACDYASLDELKAAEDERDLDAWESDSLAELIAQANGCADEDEARERIQEDPLSVEVRSDWCRPGDPMQAAEFCILLCTGGPAVRIVGELDRGQPTRAWMEYQDWGTPWTRYFGADSDVLCEYAAHFYFGE